MLLLRQAAAVFLRTSLVSVIIFILLYRIIWIPLSQIKLSTGRTRFFVCFAAGMALIATDVLQRKCGGFPSPVSGPVCRYLSAAPQRDRPVLQRAFELSCCFPQGRRLALRSVAPPRGKPKVSKAISGFVLGRRNGIVQSSRSG